MLSQRLITYLFGGALLFLISMGEHKEDIEGPCDCELHPTFVEYFEKANAGIDVHCTAQCAQIILSKCALACPERDRSNDEQYRKIIAAGEANLNKLPGSCNCPSPNFNHSSNGDNSGRNTMDNSTEFINYNNENPVDFIHFEDALPANAISESRRKATQLKNFELDNFVQQNQGVDFDDLNNAMLQKTRDISEEEKQTLQQLFDQKPGKQSSSLSKEAIDSIKYAPCYIDDHFEVHKDFALDVWGFPLNEHRFLQRIKTEGQILFTYENATFYYLIERAQTREGLSRKICSVEDEFHRNLNNDGRVLYYYHLYYLFENLNDNTLEFHHFPGISIEMEGDDTSNACSSFLCKQIVPHSDYFGSPARTFLTFNVDKMETNSRVYDFKGAWHFQKPQLGAWRIGNFTFK